MSLFKRALSFLKQGGWLFAYFIVILSLNLRTGYISLVALFCIFCIFSKSVGKGINNGGHLIILYSLFYTVFSILNGFNYDVSLLAFFSIAPIPFFLFGQEIVRRYNSVNLFSAWILIIIAYALEVLIITISNILTTGSIVGGTLRMLQIGGDSGYLLTSTQVGLPLDIAMVGLPMTVLVRKNQMRFLLILLSILSLLATFYFLNRTALIVAALCFSGVIGFKSRHNPKVFLFSVIFIIFLFLILRNLGIISDELISLYDQRNDDLLTAGSRSTR